MVKVLFVCMGNICRSPTAEGVFRQRVEREKLGHRIQIDSAGTHAYHISKPPDQRAYRAALARKVDIGNIRARQVVIEDFDEFDYILVMDEDNYADLMAICPSEHAHKVGYFLDYAPDLNTRNVPDPYYGGGLGFERVLDMVEEATEGLLEALRKSVS